MNEETTNITEQYTKKKKALLFIIAAAVVLVALAVGIGIYNTPENRVQRQLDLGNKYLEEENYEQAILAFEQAIAIDERCIEAYVGGLEAYLGAGDVSGTQDFYDRTLAMLSRLDADFVDENIDSIVEIYLMVQTIYEHDLEHAVECLMEGYRVTAGNEQVKELLVELSLKWAEELAAREEFEKAISELTNGYEETKDDRLDKKIKELQEQYKQYLEWMAYMELVEDILVRIASLCEQEDYDAAFAMMQSEEYVKFLERIDEIDKTIGLDTEYGKIGLYKVDSKYFGNYMIYYGEYAGNIRQGKGVWIGYYDGNNYLAEGTWADDQPQGEFHVREWSTVLADAVVYRLISGNVDDGLWNGAITWEFEGEQGIINSYPVSFRNGKWVILGYDEDGNAVACQSGAKGGSMVVMHGKEDGTFGIIGFAPDY